MHVSDEFCEFPNFIYNTQIAIFTHQNSQVQNKKLITSEIEEVFKLCPQIYRIIISRVFLPQLKVLRSDFLIH